MCSLTKLDNTKKSELDECKYDLGGYFIINGGERVIISQERTAGNQIHVFKQNKASAKYSHIAEVKSVDLEKVVYLKVYKLNIFQKVLKIVKNVLKRLFHIFAKMFLFVYFSEHWNHIGKRYPKIYCL